MIHRLAWSLCLILLLLPLLSPQSKRSSRLKLESTRDFFVRYCDRKQSEERGEFETNEEFVKRLNNPYKGPSTVYFQVTQFPGTKSFLYDIDAQRLTVIGGRQQTDELDQYTPQNAKTVIIHTYTQNLGTFVGTNSFGRKVTVTKSYTFDFAINLVNILHLPDSIFDHEQCAFRMSLTRAPKPAQKLSRTAVLVLGVQPLDYQKSNFECTATRDATIDSPFQTADFNYCFDARLKEILLYDTGTKSVLAAFVVSEIAPLALEADTLPTEIPMISRDTSADASPIVDSPPPDTAVAGQQPIVLKKVDPKYPNLALRAGLEGDVVVRLWVDKRGRARQARVLSSDELILNQAAIEAAMQWEFTPAYVDGKPVDVWISVPFRFRLSSQ